MKTTELVCINVPTESLAPNPWNPNHQDDFIFKKAVASIRRFGFIDPITCRRGKGNKLEIIDGEHRWKAAKEAGQKTVTVIDLGPVPADKARLLTVLLNEIKGDYNAAEMASLVNTILEGSTIEELEALLPFTRAQLDTFIALANDGWTNPELKTAKTPEAGLITIVFSVPQEALELIQRVMGPNGENVEAVAKAALEAPEESFK